jgi:hypothetical protein
MKAIILTALILSAFQTFGQESQKKTKQHSETEKVKETPAVSPIEQEQNAVPNISHKSTEPVEIELKIAEPAVKKEESPE